VKVAQLVGVWVLAVAVGVIAATLVWTTWLDTEDVVVAGPEPLSDAERVWCSNNLFWVMYAAEPLGIRIRDKVSDEVADELTALRYFTFTDLSDMRAGVVLVHDAFFRWAGLAAGEELSVFFPRVWATAPFDRLCRAAFEGR
jgi:hypothetical protein